MQNFTNKKVKLNHEALVQNELDFMEKMCQEELGNKSNDLNHKAKAVYEIIDHYKNYSLEKN